MSTVNIDELEGLELTPAVEVDDSQQLPPGITPAHLVKWQGYWSKEISASKRWLNKFHQKGVRVEKEYLGKSGNNQNADDAADDTRFNIFWANIQVILSALYAKLPEPEADRTHLDANDDIARVAAIILERIFKFELMNLEQSPADVYRQALQDRFVPGLGVVWPRYSFEEQRLEVPALVDQVTGAELAPGYTQILVTNEEAPIDYVRWDDFFYSPCRTWEACRWEARRVYMDKSATRKRFGRAISEKMAYKLPSSNRGADDPLRQSPEPLAEVFEIWDKSSKRVYWYQTGFPTLLDVKEDPLKLKGFFPAKRPIIATHTSSAYLPTPDFSMVQDQYDELNLIAHRCKLLTEALRVVGVYDKSSEGLKGLLSRHGFNDMIPVDNWALFAEKGGIKGQIDWFPLDMVVSTLLQLTERKSALIQEVYEIMGISDIMRGQTVASETATAQQLKAQYGSARTQRVQTEVAEFITQATRTRAEIICGHWSPDTIKERSQIMMTPDAQYADAAIAMLKDSNQMALRLTITADTLAAPDWNQEKQLRVDFLQAVSQFIGMSMPLIQQNPAAAPFLIQILQWATTGFKGAKVIEGVLDQALKALQQDLAAPKPPPPPSPGDQKDLAAAGKSRAEAEQIQLENTVAANALGISTGVQAPPGQGGPGRPPATALPH